MTTPKKVLPSVPHSPEAVHRAIAKVRRGRGDALPPANGPFEINAINEYGYALLCDALFRMDPWEVSFAGSMVRANYLTAKQRSILNKLIKTYLSEEDGSVSQAAE